MLIAGVDEVGRGPLAGPVLAAAVILENPISGLNDSKKLTPKGREKLASMIKAQAACFAFGRADVEEIDQLNIHHATLLAMQRAVNQLSLKPDKVLVDGVFRPTIEMDCYAVIKGDSLIQEISAASILAKVERDTEMVRLNEQYPGYGFDEHKGYPTPFHKQKLNELGPCIIHRKSYAPVANLININTN